jgi:uncharacterized membrane protein YjjP (DUF1212 family)
LKRQSLAVVAYSTTGMGIYHVFFGQANAFGVILFSAGLLGILLDIFYEKWNSIEE